MYEHDDIRRDTTTGRNDLIGEISLLLLYWDLPSLYIVFVMIYSIYV